MASNDVSRWFDPAPVYTSMATAPPECEGESFRIKKWCKTFEGAFFCGMEWDEWNLVNALVRPTNTVLELGGRFGTTSCVLARRTGNSGGVVSVEPDTKAHKALLNNRARHNCSFAVVRGTVGDTPLVVSRKFGHYATQTSVASSMDTKRAVPNLSFTTLEQRIGRPFDTLLIDCEGCIDSFFMGSNRRLLSQLTLILMEEDVPHVVDYRKWHARFRKHGFERIWNIRDTFEPSAEWSRNISHSAWRRGGLGNLPSCEQYAREAKLSRRWLYCRDPASQD